MVRRSTGVREPGSYYVFDQSTGALTKIIAQKPDLAPGDLCADRYFRFASRDGLPLSGRVTLPRDVRGKPPLVVMIGPYLNGPRARFEFDPAAQFLASRGFAVARVNVRGTSGLGADILRAGALAITRGMPDDLADAVQWLDQNGLADGGRTAICSRDWGGLIALGALTRDAPFKAWVNFCAPLQIPNVGVENAIVLGRDKEALIEAAGGRKAFAKYLRALDPLPLFKTVKIPSFLYYPRDPESGQADWGGRWVDRTLRKNGTPHVLFIARKTTRYPADGDEAAEVFGQIVTFLRQYLTPETVLEAAK